jgi:hypothetical protein
MKKTLYHFDPKTREFSGETLARFDQIEGEPLQQKSSTFISPPEAPEGSVAIFVGNEFVDGSWSIVPDRRGVYWSKTTGEMVEITELYESPGDGLTSIAPKPFETWGGSGWIFDRDSYLSATLRNIREILKNETMDAIISGEQSLDLAVETIREKWKMIHFEVSKIENKEDFDNLVDRLTKGDSK